MKIFDIIKNGVEAVVNVISDIDVSVHTTSSNSVMINGVIVDGIDDCKSVKIVVNGNAKDVETNVGNIEIHGDVSGNVEASCGNITCGKVNGDIHASCGNVTVRK